MNSILTKYRVFLICVVLTIAVAAVFYKVCTYSFVDYDDPQYVYNNPDIQAGITFKAVKWAFTTEHTGTWHPVTWLSLMLDYQFFKNWAGGYHLVNVLFHIANTLILFYVLMRMTGAVWPSAFVVAAFALHPLHVESVAWVSERKDILSTFFWMLAMWAYVRFVSHPKVINYLLVVVFLALGLMAKPMLVTLPFVLLLLDFWPLERKMSLRLLVEKIPLFICSFIGCVITLIVQQKSGALSSLESVGLITRVNNAVVSYIAYITKMIWPSRLALLYPYPGSELPIIKIIVCGLLLVLISIFFIYLSRRYRFFAVGWLWYLGTLVPVIGIVQSGAQAMADRYTYITLTGLFIIIAWSAKEFVPKQRHKILVLPAAVILIALAMTASRQAGYWKNSFALFEHSLQVTGNNYIARVIYIACLNEAGRFDEAIKQSNELLKIKPGSAEAHNDLGVTLLHTGRVQDAVEHFRLAVKYKPDYHLAHLNLAAGLQNQGKFDEAIGEYLKCLQIKPNDPNVLNSLGIIFGRQGKFDEAAAYFKQAIQFDPNFAAAKDNLDFALAEKQKSQKKDEENTKK